jgi:DNA-binding transcriptional LysR family regulator
MRRNAPEARIAARVDSVVTLLAFVKSGIGIAFLPCLDGDAEPDLVPLLDADEDFGIQLWLLTHPDLRQTARVRAFMDHMGAALDRLRPALEGHHYAG